ncbi:MAG: hypothetical protein AAB389_01335 [Patescibacteria group bacterium]
MLIYLYGPDAYRRSQKLREITKQFTDKHSALSVKRFDLTEPEEMDHLKDFSTAQSLFDTAKFGIIYGISEREPKEVDNILKIADESKEMSLVVITDKALPKPFKIFSKESVVKQSFEALAPAQLSELIKKESDSRGLKLDAQVLRGLAEKYASDTWGLVNEIDRLALGGSHQDVLREVDFFSSLNAFARSGSATTRLPLLEHLLNSEDPAKVFNVLASISPKKSLMANYDVAIKSGKLEYEEVLTNIAISD